MSTLQQENKNEIDDFKFDSVKHVYTLGGKRLYGVTSILGCIAKPALIQWSANEAVKHIEMELLSMVNSGFVLSEITEEKWKQIFSEAKTAHRKKKEDAATKGTDVHALCEEYVKWCMEENHGYAAGVDYFPSPADKDPMLFKFIDWAVENKVQFLASEKKLFSEKLWVAGTCDLMFVMNGKRYIGDIKTTSGIYDRTPFFQCAAYQLMATEQGEPPFDGRCVIRLGKDGSFEVLFSESPVDERGFLSALELFKALEIPVNEKQVHIKKAINKKKHSSKQ